MPVIVKSDLALHHLRNRDLLHIRGSVQLQSVQPNLLAMEQVAAHLDGYSPCCSITKRTARSRTSGEYRFGEFMTSSSQDMKSPVKPGRFIAWCTADTGGCNGGQGIEKTRCADCSSAVIDESRRAVWQGIYAQQIELRDLTDIGPGGTERVERDIKRCESVLKILGATEEDLADVAT